MRNVPETMGYDAEFVNQLYRVFFERPPDPFGFEAHLSALRSGLPPHNLVASFLHSDEFTALWGRKGMPHFELPRLPCILIMISEETIVAVDDGNGVRFLLERVEPVIAHRFDRFRSLLAALDLPRIDNCGILLVQFGDRAYYDVECVAYGRPRSASPAIRLIPDTYFFESDGYQAIRDAVLEGRLPRWEDRQNIVFWRGSATMPHIACDGARVERIEQVPRVAMCLALRGVPRADVAIMLPVLPPEWQFLSREGAAEWLNRKGIYRPPVSMIRHADYRFLIDIDGVANAWSFFEKLLLGACILKVDSPFEQWFYEEVVEWQHFVPVKQDLSDLIEKIDWVQQHEAEARAIAEHGQQFAMEHTLEAGREIASDAVRRSIIWARHIGPRFSRQA